MWHGIATEPGAAGAPLLVGALGWLEVRTARTGQPAGTHTFFVCAVVRAELGEDAPPLVRLGRRLSQRATVIEAVVFDLDGVLVDSEHVWDDVREQLARERGGRWHERAQADMMGMSSPEWSRYMHDVIGLSATPQEINDEVVQRMEARYAVELPLLRRRRGGGPTPGDFVPPRPGLLLKPARDRRRPRGVRPQGVLRGQRVVRGSRSAASPRPTSSSRRSRRLGIAPERSAAIEDSANGIRAARAAGMRVIAIPNGRYPPADDALELADVVLDSLAGLDARVIVP